MTSPVCDIAILGAGPAGVAAAIRCAQRGKKAILIDPDLPGGTCLHRGCIPSKVWLECAAKIQERGHQNSLGVKVASEQAVDFSTLQSHTVRVMRSLGSGIQNVLNDYGIQHKRTLARFVNGQELDVDGARLRFHKAILTCGTQPVSFPFIPRNDGRVFTTDTLFSLKELPQRILILGGGASGCEMASFFCALGSSVILVEMQERLLPQEDSDIGEGLQKIFERDGISTHCDATLRRVEAKTSSLEVRLANGGKFPVDAVLVCAGRRVNLEALNISQLHLRMENGFLWTDASQRTSRPNIFAAGDVTGKNPFAHAATAQGLVAAETACARFEKRGRARFDGFAVPRLIFSLPQAAGVGLTETQARKKNIPIKIGRYPFSKSAAALIHGHREGFVKLIAHSKSRRILGVHILGGNACELIAAAASLLSLKATISDIQPALFGHPTYSESLVRAAETSMDICLEGRNG